MATGNTIVKRITVGTPLSIGVPSTGTLIALDDVNDSVSGVTPFLKYDSDTETFKFISITNTIRGSISVTDAGGDGTLSYDVATGVITYTGISPAQVRSYFSAKDASLRYEESTGTFSIADNGVEAGTYGSSTEIPVFTVTSKGQIDSIGTTIVAGEVNGVTYDSELGIITVSTAGGSTYSDSINLSAFTTSTLTEGTNLYYLTARADSDFDIRLATKTTADLTEGSNLYYTQARFDSAAGDLTTSLVPRDDNSIDLGGEQKKWRALYLSGSTLYLGGLLVKDNSNTFQVTDSEGTVVELDLTSNNTDDLSEGVSNLYFTTSRARQSIEVGANGLEYDSGTGVLDIDETASVTLAELTTTGDAIVGGNLTVQGTTTTINSTVVSVNDLNIVLADSAGDATAANGAGITVNGANATITYASGTDTWDFNRAFGTGTNVISNYTTTELSEGTNLYYLTSRADSDFDVRLATKTTADLTEGTNLYYTTSRADSDFDVRLATKTTDNLTEGSNLYYTTARFDSDFGDNTTTDLTEGTNLYYTKVRVDSDVNQGFADRTTDNLAEGSNLYYTRARFDSALGDTTSINSIRGYFSGQGDLSYDSNTGVFQIDVETIYTADNFDSDFRVRLLTTTTDSIGEGSTNLYYLTSRADSDFDVRLATKTTTDLTEGTNLYYTSARADSDAKNAVSVTDAGGDGSLTYSAATGIITYTGPSASEVRAHFNGSTGVTLSGGDISIGQAVDSSANVTFNNITANDVTLNSITNDAGIVYNTPTTTQATSDATVVVDTTAHNSDFVSIEYTVHMDDSDNANSQISKVLLTYNKTNVSFTEYAVIDTFVSEDSDMGILDADVSGGDIRLKFTRSAGVGTVNVKPIKTIIT